MTAPLAMAAIFDLANIDSESWMWRAEAACLGEDQEIFYPERGESTAPAKEICSICPVRAECLEFGLRFEKRGIWGGTSERERRRMRQRMGIRLIELTPIDECDGPDDIDDEEEDDEWQ